MGNLSDQEVIRRLKNAAKMVEEGALYHHYKSKDNHYKVLHLATQEATEKVCVVYQALYGSKKIWVRDLDVWLEKVEYNGKKVKRFTKLKS